jgi:hypothetical protein
MESSICGVVTLSMVLYCDEIGFFPYAIDHAKKHGYDDPVVVLVGESMLDVLSLPVGVCPRDIRERAFHDQDIDKCPRFVPFVLPFEDLVAWAAVSGNESEAQSLKNYPGVPTYVINEEGGTFLSFSPSLCLQKERT